MNLIACVSNNYGIGMKRGDLLFHIKNDMQNFKKLTENSIVVCGRKTFESIIEMNGQALPKRTNVVLTRNNKYKSQYGEIVFHDAETIIKHYKIMTNKDKEVWIIGGKEVYEKTLPYVEKVYLTKVYKDAPEAQVFYPIELQEKLGFKEVEKSDKFYSQKYDAFYQFILYERSGVDEESKS